MKIYRFRICFIVALSICSTTSDSVSDYCDINSCDSFKSNFDLSDLLVVTVASERTDGYERYLRSAKLFEIEPQVLGLDEPWLGGDVAVSLGGGYKINLLKTYLEPYKDDPEKIILFTDSYDIIFLENLTEIVNRFKKFNARVVFSAESSCWPLKSLSDEYPELNETQGKRFLNSGGFIGYIQDIYEIITLRKIENEDDDQLYYTKAYLDKDLREKHQIKLDHLSEIFQNLNGAVSEVQLNFLDDKIELENIVYKTKPTILHGNGVSKLVLNRLGNYIPKAWSSKTGCIACLEDTIDLTDVPDEDIPVVVIGIFIEEATPFMEEFFDKIDQLSYPKKKLHLFIHNNVKYHRDLVGEFIEKKGAEYASVKTIHVEDEFGQVTARNLALDHCLKKKCDYYLNVDSEAHLDHPYTLKMLIEQNRGFVGPMLARPGKSWSNFWGALSSDGFYARSTDYMAIVNEERRGLWNVPYVSGCYLIKGTLLEKFPRDKLGYVNRNELLDADMALCANLRALNIFMYVSNRANFGHLINTESFDTTLASPDMYQIFDNRYDWEKRYIHEDYMENFNPKKNASQPCPDVYWFPVTTMRFCKDLINMMETFGKWSDGENNDPRLDSGYEAVPTRDIHMNQVGWEKHWLYFLKEFVRPLQESVFVGYYHDPPRALMNFVVRYRPNEQASLRPHHDSSTYTVNLALNTPGVDYEGGGCHFIRYNCSIPNTRPGWLLMHPGRLTHYHEGLLVTKGTRYIMISFVDP